jgi:IS30 family transposase
MKQLKIKLVKEIVSKKRKVAEVAEILEVDRKTVGRWKWQYIYGGEAALVPKKSGPKNGTAWNRTSEEIESMVSEIAKKNPFKGPVWISDQLTLEIDQTTVYRILKRNGVRYYSDYKHTRRKKKSYCLSYPGQELQLDTCFPFGYQKQAVVYDTVDDCSRWAFARVMPNRKEETTIQFLKELIERAPFNVQAIRTDQGTEFSSHVEEFLTSQGIELRRNPPYTPQHNGKVERYHRTFKEQAACFWHFHASLESLNLELQKWLFYYNYKRKHTGLGMDKMTPIQKISYTIIQDSFFHDKNGTLILQQNKT